MSKARPQSLKRAISRGTNGRGKHYTSKGEAIMKEPRIITEFIDTFGKLFILKRSKCGHNRKRSHLVKQRPYYNVIGQV